jgi:cytochrome P450
MFADPDFMPFTPRLTPSYRATVDNFLENYPPQAYRGDIFYLRGLPPIVPRTVYLTDPALIEEMLITRADEFTRDRLTVGALSSPINRDALFFAEGADWKWQHRAVAPAFRHDAILALVPTFAQCARAQVDVWRAAPAGVPVDVMAAMSETTYSVIERAVLGAAGRVDHEKFFAALSPSLGGISWRLLIALFGLPPNWIPHPGYLKMMRAAKYLRDESLRLLAERRAQGESAGPRKTILDLLLSARDPESGRSMTDSELAANLYSFLVAGHETSAVALGWALWLIAKDQASQQRLRAEVARIAGDAEIDSSTVDKLAFTRQVVQEAMRLFPPAAAIGRQPRMDLRLGPYALSRKEPVYATIWCLHRHEKYWEAPNAFDPDRFTPEKIKARPRCAYLPFGAGPRICIGMNFAMLEMVTILATLTRAFRFETIPGHKLTLSPSFTLRPKGGLPVLATPI